MAVEVSLTTRIDDHATRACKNTFIDTVVAVVVLDFGSGVFVRSLSGTSSFFFEHAARRIKKNKGQESVIHIAGFMIVCPQS
jgi:hypothetical protein